LIHPDEEACNAFSGRFAGLPNVSVLRSRFEDLPPHDCFVTAGNSFGMMTAGIDAATRESIARLIGRTANKRRPTEPGPRQRQFSAPIFLSKKFFRGHGPL
jgi:hypothetical protein